MTQPLVSFLLPTRARAQLAARTIESILTHAIDPNTFEVLLGVDDDDRENTITLGCDLGRLKVRHRFVTFPRLGYSNLHHYNNALARSATGKWLWIWNDDCLLRTPAWDRQFAAYAGHFSLLDPVIPNAAPEFQHGLFPCVPAQWLTTLGYLSANRHCDTYMCLIADALRLRRKVTDLAVFHDRFDETGDNNDLTYQERSYATSDFYNDPAILAQLNLDARRLARMLGIPVSGLSRVADGKTVQKNATLRLGADIVNPTTPSHAPTTPPERITI